MPPLTTPPSPTPAGSPKPSHPCLQGAFHSLILPGKNAFSKLIAKHSGWSCRRESRSTPRREVTRFLRTFLPPLRACSLRWPSRPGCRFQGTAWSPVAAVRQLVPCLGWTRRPGPSNGECQGRFPMPHSIAIPWGLPTQYPLQTALGAMQGLWGGGEESPHGKLCRPHPHHPKSVGSSMPQGRGLGWYQGAWICHHSAGCNCLSPHLWCQAQTFCIEVNPFKDVYYVPAKFQALN